jgi:hypothetical protein
MLRPTPDLRASARLLANLPESPRLVRKMKALRECCLETIVRIVSLPDKPVLKGERRNLAEDEPLA